MFVSFSSSQSYSEAVGCSRRVPGLRRAFGRNAFTIFSDSSGPVMKISFVTQGSRGNNFVANLLKLSGVKYRFRLWDSAGTRLNTITEDRTSFSPPDVIEELVDSINNNATFKLYVQATFIKETTEAISSSVDIGDGQRLRGGQ